MTPLQRALVEELEGCPWLESDTRSAIRACLAELRSARLLSDAANAKAKHFMDETAERGVDRLRLQGELEQANAEIARLRGYVADGIYHEIKTEWARLIDECFAHERAGKDGTK